MERGGCGWSVVGTLLGPERAGDRFFSCQGLPASRTAAALWGGGSGGVMWRVSGRTLRTAQWTRASFRLLVCSRVLVGPHNISFRGWCVGFLCGQVVKGTRWMPGHQEPMKDVGGCDKPRGAVNRAVIRGCPNGETQHE